MSEASEWWEAAVLVVSMMSCGMLVAAAIANEAVTSKTLALAVFAAPLFLRRWGGDQ